MYSKEKLANFIKEKQLVGIGSYIVGLTLEVPLVGVVFGNILLGTPMPSELGKLGLFFLALGGAALASKGVKLISQNKG